MLSIFDTIFVISATVSFSLPILSELWKVIIYLIYWEAHTTIPWPSSSPSPSQIQKGRRNLAFGLSLKSYGQQPHPQPQL